VKSKKTFRSQAVVNQNAETELMLEGDDDAVSLLQEKEIDNLAGNYIFHYNQDMSQKALLNFLVLKLCG